MEDAKDYRTRARRLYATTLIGDVLEIAVQAYVEGAHAALGRVAEPTEEAGA